MRQSKKIVNIARPTASKMTQLRSSLSKEIETRLSIKLFLIMRLISFTGSMLLHVNVWLYQRY